MTGSYVDQINAHYGAADISGRIDAALRAAGRDPANPTRDDTAWFDEFHGGGRESTRALARFAELAPGLNVLDIGCGIGGPARTLAVEFGCLVTGIDLTTEFVRAAERLTTRLRVEPAPRCLVANATRLPFVAGSFDLVWSQNMLMNIADKRALVGEIARVLRPDGCFAFESVLAGRGEVHYPCFWAAEPDLSFLATAANLREMLSSAGLDELKWQDTTSEVIASGRKRLAALGGQGPVGLNVGVIVPDRVQEKMQNALRNNEEGRTQTLQAVFRRRA
jgi:SAM-dependent methyltransferase